MIKVKKNTKPTHNERIMIANVREEAYHKVETKIEELINSASLTDNNLLVAKMKALVPEFISNNSVFQHLDKA